MQAVVKIGQSQYFVSPGQEILIPVQKNTDKLVFNQVCLLIDDQTISIGTPYITDLMVFADKISEEKGEKINIFKYKSKSRYRKSSGFRSKLFKVKITQIGSTVPNPKSAKKSIRETNS